MLGGIIKYNTGGISHGSSLASGVNPEDITQTNNQIKGVMRTAGKVPHKTSPQAIMNDAQKGQFFKDQSKLLKTHLKVKQEQTDSALDVRDTVIEHAIHGMKAEQRFQKQSQRLSHAQYDHRLNVGITQAQSEGTRQAYDQQSVFDSML